MGWLEKAARIVVGVGIAACTPSSGAKISGAEIEGARTLPRHQTVDLTSGRWRFAPPAGVIFEGAIGNSYDPSPDDKIAFEKDGVSWTSINRGFGFIEENGKVELRTDATQLHP